jgi:glycosyltransferase involved in cell wall biosynthesis
VNSTLSVIIPAHNEEAVIGRCLDALLHGARPSELEVIVVCNGCTDRTADVARAHGAVVRVIETDVPGKANALNLGDRAASGFPRLYVDADAILPIESVRTTAEALTSGDILAAAPLLSVDLTNRPWPVRAYYNVWLQLPYCRAGMLGSGVQAVSEEGRKRFTSFPAVTADDAFLRLHFAPSERRTIEECRFWISPPTTVADIIKVKTRSHFGNVEILERFPHLRCNQEVSHGPALVRMSRDPRRWPAMAVYIYVKIATRLRVWWCYRGTDKPRWERDDTSRQHVTPAGQLMDHSQADA